MIRPATPNDISTILGLIRELAVYEKLEHEVVATEADLHKYLFGQPSRAECVLVEDQRQVIGFALFFHNFSTFLAKPGLYLEDLYIRPEFRGQGWGKKTLAHLAALAVERDCGRMEWAVLDWNSPALEFYKSLGAHPKSDWIIHRLTGSALTALARS